MLLPALILSLQQAVPTGLAVAPVPAPFLRDETALRLPSGLGSCGGATLAADLDGDGWPDLVLARDPGLTLLFGSRSGQFGEAAPAALPFPPLEVAASLAVADVDGDGDLDLFTGSDGAPGSADRLWLNLGGAQGASAGAFAAASGFPTGAGTGSPCLDAAFGDVDGDGDPDLVLARGQGAHGTGAGAPNQLYLNDGAGGFTPSAGFRTGSWNAGSQFFSTEGLVLADLSGDGLLDVFFANADSGAAQGGVGHPNQLLLGLGNGSFVDRSDLLPGFEDNSSGAVALDLDGDGDLDLAVANSLLSVPGALSGDLLVNQGGAQSGAAGLFLDCDSSPLEEASLASGIRLGIAAGDLDLDGAADLLVSVHALSAVGADHLLLRGRPSTTTLFERAAWFDPAESVSPHVLLHDLDGDGDLDVLLSHCGSFGGIAPPFQLLVNLSVR